MPAKRRRRANLGPKQRGVASVSRKAALVYMESELTMAEVAERFGISKTAVYDAVDRLRAEQRYVWPEDELTL
jgi:predicted DNA-binding protein YlxM (UPF0122 family)